MTEPKPTSQRELRASDLDAVREQLGREPSTPFVVVARCTGGHPLVIRNAPIDAAGDPFPTTYWLTCPEAVRAVSRVESRGWIGRLNDRMGDDDAFRDAVDAAHSAYAADRGADLAEAAAWGGVAGTAAGIKCLHAHYAYRPSASSPRTQSSGRGGSPRSTRARTRSGCWCSSPASRPRSLRPNSRATW